MDITQINNETLGMAAEKVICDKFGLDSSSIAHRSHPELELRLRPNIDEAFLSLPKPIKHVGLSGGERGGASKSTVDFILETNETLSVKTNSNRNWKQCPSECGQPGAGTFDIYFGHLYEGSIDYDKAKTLVLEKMDQMIPIYLEHLFDNDYLLLAYLTSRGDGFMIFNKSDIPKMKWEPERFSFTKQTPEAWNESNTIKYDGISIAEFQLHQHRNNYKFRFNIVKLNEILSR